MSADEAVGGTGRPAGIRRRTYWGMPAWAWAGCGASVALVAAVGVWDAVRYEALQRQRAADAVRIIRPEEPRWARLDDPAGAFVAHFPGGPAAESNLAAELKTRSWTRSFGSLVFNLVETELPPDADPAATDNGLAAFVTSMVDDIGHRPHVIAEADHTIAGRPAKVVTLRGRNNPRTVAVWGLIVAGSRGYVLGVVIVNDGELTASDAFVTLFFNGFELK